MATGGNPGLSWPASLCFAFLSSFVSILLTLFVMKKRNRTADPAAATSNDATSRSTSGRSVDPSCSSSVSGQPGYEYDVFLSFRGEDTRKGFGDSLYTALEDAGLRVFRDNERLPFGREIGPELLKGIKMSSISIPIFSENYASSKWCLEEFAFIMECREARKQLVLPVFYDVTPNEVQHQTGSYARAFRHHAKKQDPKTVQKWTKALLKVGFLKGWEVKNEANGYQGKLIKMIVTKVLRELKMGQLSVNNFLVGIDYQVEAVMEMLALEEPDVRFVGIWGMGGIGKTALAKAIYNKILDDFDNCSFLQDIREMSTRNHNGLKQLQSQLVADLLRWDRPDFDTTDQGIYVLKRSLREMKVLILLDDIDRVDQLKALAAELDWFGRGSRIIITTRNKDVLRVPQEHPVVYEVRELGQDDALQLFYKHALRKDAPTVKLRALSEEIVMRTGGLPLALEVIGSFLLGKNENIWKATSEKLKRVPNEEVQHKLKISYDGLEHGQQQMFLDIACLFNWGDKRTVEYMWEDCYKFSVEVDLEVLQLLSLVKIIDDNSLWMHDQLRDLGKEIVRRENFEEPGKRSRLWGNEALDVLQNDQGSGSIEAIRLEYEFGLEDCCFTPQQFSKLTKLRFLQLDCANLAGNFEYLLPELRWLRWRVPSFNCTTNLNLKKLLILDLSDSRVTHGWNVWDSIQVKARKLKVLELSYCRELTRTPNFLSEFRNLERLNLSNCGRLEVIDSSVSKLKHLTSLNLTNCRRLKELPEHLDCKKTLQELVIDGTRLKELPDLEGFMNLEILSARYAHLTKLPSYIGHLTSLGDLRLNQSKITELPESIGSLVTLRRLTLATTPIKELPKSIGGLKSLVELVLSKTKVSILPDSIENLVNLQVLKIDHCSIQCLPSALGKLENLESLDASGCRFLGEIPIELGRLSLLKVLLLRHTNISNIPETMRCLSRLETLDLGWCKQLRSLPELPCNLSSVSLTCQEPVPIPNLPDLVKLKKLEFIQSVVSQEILELSNLEMLHISRSNVSILLDGLGAIRMLKDLSVGNVNFHCLPELPLGLHKLHVIRCHSLTRLSELSKLSNLSELTLHSCPELTKVEDLGNLLSLRRLTVSFCGKIATLDGLEKLESLTYLDVSECESLERLPDLSKLSGLSDLIRVTCCRKLSEIEGIGSLQALDRLSVFGCDKLKGLDGVDELEKLHLLDIGGCQSIRRLPNLSKLKSLEHLLACGCEKLASLDGLDKLEALTSLWIDRCKSIEKLPSLSNLKLLKELSANGCEKLQVLEGLECLERIDWLDISGCKAIESMPDLSNLKSLQVLLASGCEKLQGLDGLDKLVALMGLNISGCKSIVRLPNLSNLRFLEYFEADGCEKLQVEGLKSKGLAKTEVLPQFRLFNYLRANGVEKLQELNEYDELMAWTSWYDFSPEKLVNESNYGLLRQWYVDGCEKVPELEGLEKLEKYHLQVLPGVNELRFHLI